MLTCRKQEAPGSGHQTDMSQNGAPMFVVDEVAHRTSTIRVGRFRRCWYIHVHVHIHVLIRIRRFVIMCEHRGRKEHYREGGASSYLPHGCEVGRNAEGSVAIVRIVLQVRR